MEDKDRINIYKFHASFCKILSDANRLLIINELGKGELPVGELSRRLGLAQSNVSKHLGLMREHGLVATRRNGASIFYSLSDARISEAIRLLRDVQADHFERQRELAQTKE